MKVINLEMSSSVMRGSKHDAYKCLRECFSVLQAANAMVESLRDWSETTNVSTQVYLDIQLQNAEHLLECLETPAIDAYQCGCFSRMPTLNTRLPIFQVLRDQLVVILDDIVDAYIDMTDKEREAVSELSKKILEQLSFFTFYEFSFDATTYSLKEDTELEVNEVVLEYVGRDSYDLTQKVMFMLQLYIQYRPTIPSFDFTDEEIDMFYYYAGVFSHTLLDNIDDLDVEVARKIAHGELDPEEVIAQMFPQEDVKRLAVFD